MKNLGYFMVALGFLGGAFATSLDVQNVNWTIFISMAAAAVLGLVIYKMQVGALARSEEVLETNRVELRESIANVVNDLQELNNDNLTRGAVLRDRIDLKLREDLRRFADARQSMVHLFGLQTYADIMSEFAAGERYVNRVWSSAADGYDDEARRYLHRANGQFQHAQAELREAASRLQ